MATRRTKRRAAAPRTRTVYRTSKRRYSRRRSGVNASVKKKMATVGTAVGLAKYVVPIAINSIQSKSVTPITTAFTDKNTLMAMGKDALIGYAIGYGAGMVADLTGLKKPINKITKKVGL